MKALRIYAGPAARRHIEAQGLRPQDVRTIPGAAGGPKGLILGPIDRFVFGQWLAQSDQPVHLVGASIGAWRLATACLGDPVAAFERFEHDYVRQQFEVPPGQKRLSPHQLSERFAESLQAFYGGCIGEVLAHPRYRLHVVTSRGRHILGREGRARTPVGYLGAFASNSVHRKTLGAWLERCVFSTPGAALPFGTRDFRTRQHALREDNFNLVLQASCSIPFLLAAVHDIPGAPRGAYWDGGITDYHLHLDYQPVDDGLVLYPHFQRAVVPGWLDKGLRWRHKSTGFLDRMVVLAPDPDWVKTLPNGKLPDRKDFIHFQNDAQARIAAWTRATREAERLSDELQEWLARGSAAEILPL
jgi:hypothetical protein